MFLVTASDSRCVVRGERLVYTPTGAEGWESFTDSCSPMAEVFYDPNRGETVQTEGEASEKVTTVNSGAKTGKRGRRRIHTLALPVDQEFTVAEIAKKMKVDKYIINNEVARIKRTAPSTIKEVRTVKGGRGKPATVFKIGSF